MAKGKERVERLLLEKELSVPEYAVSNAIALRGHEGEDSRQAPNRTFSGSSAVSSASTSSYCCSDASNGKSSVSTGQSSLSSLPPQEPLALLNQQIAMTEDNLSCEHANISECHVRFHPSHFQYWFNHSLTHFRSLPPPPKSLCIFCNDDDAVFENRADPSEAWRRRMSHIYGHFENPSVRVPPKPDFFVIDYLWENNLISEADYSSAIGYTERPECDGLVPYDFKIPEKALKEERSVWGPDDLEREERQRRKEERGKGKGKGKQAPRFSHKSRIISKIRN